MEKVDEKLTSHHFNSSSYLKLVMSYRRCVGKAKKITKKSDGRVELLFRSFINLLCFRRFRYRRHGSFVKCQITCVSESGF